MSAASFVDDDEDGLPDLWEIQYFGTIDGVTPQGDPDGDALSNLVEYGLGSDPTSNMSDNDAWDDRKEYYYGTNLTNPFSYPNRSLVNITLDYPKFGVSPASPFDLRIKTSNASDCKYTLSETDRYDTIDAAAQKFSSDDFLLHRLRNFPLATSFETSIYVFCKTKSGYVNDDFPQEFVVSIDSTEPVILSAEADPEFVIEKLEVELSALTDDRTICKFPPADTNISELQKLFNDAKVEDFKTETTLLLDKNTKPSISDNRRYEFLVVCMNKAEMVRLDQIGFSVNLSVPNMITEKYPSGVLRTKAAQFRVMTNKDATCRFGEGYINMFPQVGKDHYLDRTNLSEGQNRIPIMCLFNDAAVINDHIEFLIDMTAPSITTIEADLETCLTERLEVEYESPDTDIANFTVRLIDSKNKLIASMNTTSKNVTFTNLSLARGEKYFWEISANDVTGNNGTAKKSVGTQVLLATSETCITNKDPYLEYSAKMSPEGARVLLGCKDPDGTCSSIYYDLVDGNTNSTCSVCGSCGYDKYLSTSMIQPKEDATLCYNLTDNKGASVTGELKIKFSSCTGNISCCLGQQAQVCDANCTVVADMVDCSLEKQDSDGDGYSDQVEEGCGLDPKVSADAMADNDGDTLKNIDECTKYKTDMNKRDTDGDGYDDNIEIRQGTDPLDAEDFPIDVNADSDGDGIKDSKETECGLDPKNKDDADEDYDGDGLTNKEECVRYGTDINNPDTDGDGYSDSEELDKGTNPRDPEEFPKSHVLNIIMFILGIPLVATGAFLLLKDMPKGSSVSYGTRKPLVDMSKAKKEMAATYQPAQSQQQASRSAQNDAQLDQEIRKKREELRMKKMTSVFDEFAEDRLPPSTGNAGKQTSESVFQAPPQQSQQQSRENQKVFNRLDTMNTPIEDLERLKRRKNV
jgi:hypothetical protein